MIVAANVAGLEEVDSAVFDFVLIATGERKIFQQIRALGLSAGAVVLEQTVIGEVAELLRGDGRRIGLRAEGVGIGGIETLFRVVAVLPVVCFAARNFVMPAGSGGEIPASIGLKSVENVALVKAGRSEDGLAGNAGAGIVVAEGKTELIVAGEFVAVVPRKGAIEKGVVGTLAVGAEVRARG